MCKLHLVAASFFSSTLVATSRTTPLELHVPSASFVRVRMAAAVGRKGGECANVSDCVCALVYVYVHENFVVRALSCADSLMYSL